MRLSRSRDHVFRAAKPFEKKTSRCSQKDQDNNPIMPPRRVIQDSDDEAEAISPARSSQIENTLGEQTMDRKDTLSNPAATSSTGKQHIYFCYYVTNLVQTLPCSEKSTRISIVRPLEKRLQNSRIVPNYPFSKIQLSTSECPHLRLALDVSKEAGL